MYPTKPENKAFNQNFLAILNFLNKADYAGNSNCTILKFPRHFSCAPFGILHGG
jgi:hypothetical protein